MDEKAHLAYILSPFNVFVFQFSYRNPEAE